MAKRTHIHKYQFKNIGNKDKPRKVYACAYPDCSHYMPTVEMAKGKETICHQCGEKMILSNDIIRQRTVKPRCLYCRGKLNKAKTHEEVKVDRAIEMLIALKGN